MRVNIPRGSMAWHFARLGSALRKLRRSVLTELLMLYFKAPAVWLAVAGLGIAVGAAEAFGRRDWGMLAYVLALAACGGTAVWKLARWRRSL